jgi:hypothetical protein
LADLVERLLSATEPARDLDYDLWKLLPPDGGDRSNPYDAPRFTRNIDAAMMLVPKGYTEAGWYGDRFYLIGNGNRWGCAIQQAVNVGHWSERWQECTAKDCATPAIAICVAAVRALSPLGDVRGGERG